MVLKNKTKQRQLMRNIKVPPFRFVKYRWNVMKCTFISPNFLSVVYCILKTQLIAGQSFQKFQFPAAISNYFHVQSLGNVYLMTPV